MSWACAAGLTRIAEGGMTWDRVEANGMLACYKS